MMTLAAGVFGFCLGGLFGALFASHPLWRDAFLAKVRGMFKKKAEPVPAPVIAKPFVMNDVKADVKAAVDPHDQSLLPEWLRK